MQHHIFKLTFLQIIKASIISKKNDLVSELLEDQFKLETMVTQRDKGEPKKSEGLPVSLPVLILETQNNTEV